jgi:hypothetical protein
MFGDGVESIVSDGEGTIMPSRRSAASAQQRVVDFKF